MLRDGKPREDAPSPVVEDDGDHLRLQPVEQSQAARRVLSPRTQALRAAWRRARLPLFCLQFLHDFHF